jgi:site-specific DNA-cytosine methylase
MMRVFVDLFSGINGFYLGAYFSGLHFDRHYFSEIDNYAVQVCKKRFPEAINLGDIKRINWRKLCKEINKEEPAQVLVTGGFP